MDKHNAVSAMGILILLGCAWLVSADRKRMNWRVVSWGVGLQLLIGLFIFALPGGTRVFQLANDAVTVLLTPATKGAEFLFGPLALPPGATSASGDTSIGFILAFQAFPTIIFFSALVAILYYIRVMPLIVRAFASVFTNLMRISGAESLCAASNIFVGIESTLTVKPHLQRMTPSELCTVLTAGMATVASNVLLLYVMTLRDLFPNIAGHLVSASLLSAPAALVMAKIVFPESGTPETLGKSVRPHYERESSLFEAVINGANSGVRLIVGIVALLLAVPADDVVAVSRIIGERVVLTEVVSYRDLAMALENGVIHHQRSAVIATYALCGFAHVASMAIFVGGVAALAPDRTRDLAKVGVRALVAATLACLMTACVAGLFYRDAAVVPLGI